MPIISRISLLIFISLITLTNHSQAQDRQPRKLRRFQIISDLKKRKIDYANIVNLSTNRGTACDHQGHFSMRLGPQDTLKISRVGYFSKTFYPPDSLYYRQDSIIYLVRKNVMIDEVLVKGLSWQRFKAEIESTPVPGPDRLGTDTVLTYLDKAGADLANRPPGVGVALPLNILTDRQKQYTILEEWKKREWKEKLIQSKFNRDMVEKITGLRGQALTDFILFARFTDGYLLLSNEYDIILEVGRRYKIYKRMRTNSEIGQD